MSVGSERQGTRHFCRRDNYLDSAVFAGDYNTYCCIMLYVPYIVEGGRTYVCGVYVCW